MGELTDIYARRLREDVAKLPEHPSVGELNDLLRRLAQWRSRVVKNTYLSYHGRVIRSGPFEGMDYVSEATEGALIPRLLGTYECELHPHLLAFCEEGVETVIDVGCAEGYYAVGLARLLPQATVHAFDIDAKARAACADLAQRNGVAERVIVGERFDPTDFEAFAGRRALVIMDVEGAEIELLRPDLSPALADMRLIVETHSGDRTQALQARFAPTHDVQRVDLGVKEFEMPPWLAELAHLDQLLAVWEWRRTPTPWLVMRPKTA